MMNISHHQCTLTVCSNSQTETYLVESPNIEYTQVDRVSNFSPTGIARYSFFDCFSFQSSMQPLAAADQSGSQLNTNLSRSISLSILDENLNEISIQTNLNDSIEIVIPRDPNLIISSMYLQNVISTNFTLHNQLFNLHYVNISSTYAISVHFEIRSLNSNLGYLFIYKFDSSPQLNSSIDQIDGWTLFCPSSEILFIIYLVNVFTYRFDK
jgi:hypothetical protein